MNNQEHDLQTGRRATVLTLDGQLIANGSIILQEQDSMGEFHPDAGCLMRGVPANQIAIAVVEGSTYRLRGFHLKQGATTFRAPARCIFEIWE